MVINLNEVYREELMYYWCNRSGEINMPGYRRFTLSSADMLPPVAKYVYDNFCLGECYAGEYVVTYNGETGLALGWLFDYSWLEDLGVLPADNEVEVKDAFHKAVRDAADVLTIACSYPVLYGMDTDPDGDEILVFLSSDILMGDKTKAMEEIHRLAVGKDSVGERLYERVKKAMNVT